MRFCDAALLYAVSDRSWTQHLSLYEQAERAIAGGITCLQLREKNCPYGEFAAEIADILPLCRRNGVPLIVNDCVQAAVNCKADGVHVGQSDMPAREVRRIIGPDMLLGVSVQTVEQALQAQLDGADYLGAGAVFATPTKPDAAEVPLAVLRSICRAVRIPVVAIGGINRNTIRSLSGSGVSGVAVVSALFGAPDIAAAARELRRLAAEVCAHV